MMSTIKSIVTLLVVVITTNVVEVQAWYCCLCGQKPGGGCYELGRTGKTMDGAYTCAELESKPLQQGPCSIAQAWAFSTGGQGCGCPVDEREVLSTPSCSTCAEGTVRNTVDANGKETFHYFKIGALKCKEAYNYAKAGYVPSSLCDATKNELLSNGCCGTGSNIGGTSIGVPTGGGSNGGSSSNSGIQYGGYCTATRDCTNKAYPTCDTRRKKCSNFLAAAKRTRSKRLNTRGYGGTRGQGRHLRRSDNSTTTTTTTTTINHEEIYDYDYIGDGNDFEKEEAELIQDMSSEEGVNDAALAIL